MDSFQVSNVIAECPQQVQDADRREQAGEPSGTQTASSYSAELKKQLADITRKYTDLQDHHAAARNSIKGLKNQVQRLESEIRNFSKNVKFLDEDQLRALSRSNNRGNSWTPETVKQGLQIKFACGTTGYETLRKLGYPLPSNRTLTRRLEGLKFLPGILHEVIDVMRCKAMAMEEVEKDCILFLDEMEISSGYELDRAEDALLGGKTLPPKPDEPANHAGQLLSSSVFTLSDATVKENNLPSSEVKLEHVQAVLDYDAEHELKVAPNLCEVHTSSGHFTKMKEYVSEGDNLIYPSDDVMHMLKIYEEHFVGINSCIPRKGLLQASIPTTLEAVRKP
ncbi:uncharacterized protein [Dermacentor andersoni]|uniref:uncharacterized protein n=1 Tax=Dermacentor andersoni TaxID=34620 RepID=UPI003B3A0FCB